MGIIISQKDNNCYQQNIFLSSFTEISFKNMEECCLLTENNKDEFRQRKYAGCDFY